MELKVSSPKAECLSPSDCVSDSEEKDVSDDDDDDRNHKHRRREIGSESMERDSLEQTCLPSLKNDALALPHFPEFQTRFINRYLLILALVGVEEGNLVLGANMTLGKGLPNVSDSQSPSWSAFGLIPGIPNGGMDTLHSPGMQRSLRTSLAPSLNIVLPPLPPVLSSMESPLNLSGIFYLLQLKRFEMLRYMSIHLLLGDLSGRRTHEWWGSCRFANLLVYLSTALSSVEPSND
ncbi:hypothetical protein Acr_00g0039920 [Actinidia rufa]|uniref:Uncharacterized protein n=1 Tax=Actinidia rufa TaxID=165716 RepID=A0A7J0DIS4_9ERIC|nr:hypothetical protein Acr_00g0039920 [Actinidia rufa]